MEAGALYTDLPQAVGQIGFDLGAVQSRQLVLHADARIECPVLLQAQGVVQVVVADEHQGKDRLASQVQPQQQAHCRASFTPTTASPSSTRTATWCAPSWACACSIASRIIVGARENVSA